jgi:phospholipid/cholesterol/gamma-HCH transport system substrate-binding protein
MAAVITLGSQRKTFSKGITVKAVFDNVNGLQAGNNIWFSGVKVGTVKKMQLTNNARVVVSMTIDQRSKNVIHEDALAKIGSDGFLGNKIVIIYGGSMAKPVLRNDDVLNVGTVPDQDKIMNTLQENNKNLLEITSDFKVISKRLADGQGTIGKLLTDDGLANQLQSTADVLNKASANIQALTSNVADYTSKLQTKGVLANDLVSDTSLFKSLKTAVAQIQSASDNAKNLTTNLKGVVERINDSTNTVGVLLHDQQAATNLKSATENLQSGTEKFNEDMEALQHNFLFRGFFRKKEKQEKEQQKQQQQKQVVNKWSLN